MKCVILLLVCAVAVGCATSRRAAARRQLEKVDPTLGRERSRVVFEGRLHDLGAKIQTGASPTDERIATLSAPRSPGYFPPPLVRIVYTVNDGGYVVIERTEVVSLNP